MHATPYCFFYGICEEALAFYRVVFGGTYELQRNDTGPLMGDVPPNFRGKVMHAKFMVGGRTLFFASDGLNAKHIAPEASNVAIMIETVERAESDHLFTALSSGGTVIMPLKEEFWGGRLGVVSDRFGIEWILSSP